MKIYLFTVNHKKPAWLQQEQKSYHNRLPSYVHVNEQQISPSNKKKEAEALQKLTQKLTEKNIIKVALCIDGKKLSSMQFAMKLERWQQMGRSLVFYVGGADGLDDTLVKQCQFIWSFSPLTFSHLIAQLVFSEQLYRAFSILQGHPYHLSHE